ncbi:Protein of unknown function [Gryllus bimaculatus]|nr:Protein of unknown function [Gryllus bimaculatus]
MFVLLSIERSWSVSLLPSSVQQHHVDLDKLLFLVIQLNHR